LVDDFYDGYLTQVIVGQVQGLDCFIIMQEQLDQTLLTKLQFLFHCTVHETIGSQSTSFQVEVLQFEAWVKVLLGMLLESDQVFKQNNASLLPNMVETQVKGD
jgi:hypothetical protein